MTANIFKVGLLLVVSLYNIQACTNDTAPQTIKASEVHEKLEQDPGVIIDVRTKEEFEEGHLAEADRHLDLLNGDFEAELNSLDKNRTYYLYCRSGNRSGQAAELMIDNGFSNVYNIGGFQELGAAGFEAE